MDELALQEGASETVRGHGGRRPPGPGFVCRGVSPHPPSLPSALLRPWRKRIGEKGPGSKGTRGQGPQTVSGREVRGPWGRGWDGLPSPSGPVPPTTGHKGGTLWKGGVKGKGSSGPGDWTERAGVDVMGLDRTVQKDMVARPLLSMLDLRHRFLPDPPGVGRLFTRPGPPDLPAQVSGSPSRRSSSYTQDVDGLGNEGPGVQTSTRGSVSHTTPDCKRVPTPGTTGVKT